MTVAKHFARTAQPREDLIARGFVRRGLIVSEGLAIDMKRPNIITNNSRGGCVHGL